MKEYRITKYNPQNRVKNIYKTSEWTSISDIGKMFDTGILTYGDYKKVEQAYIDCCIAIIRKEEIIELSVCNPEYYNTDFRFPQTISNEREMRQAIMYCLQEKCWAKLESKSFFIHFGYDYYMYIGSTLPCSVVEEIAKEYNLFCEHFHSPYNL